MVLDNVTSEVSKKVKSAIKAKLTELGAYVDDELPDYIMILVGNKKTKDQMDDDLSLFLGHNTERFTLWLHTVLKRLNDASLLQREKPVKEKEKKKDEEEKKPEDEVPEVPATSTSEEKKKHKKKKDKSEKKKEKKEKKKKKDKDKDKEKHSKSQKNKSKSKSPVGNENGVAASKILTAQVEGTEKSLTLKQKIEPLTCTITNEGVEKTSLELKTLPTIVEPEPPKDEDISEDVVNLRPDAEDLALGLEDEPPVKKLKTTSSVKEVVKEPLLLPHQLQTIEVKVDIDGGKEVTAKSHVPDVPEPADIPTAHDVDDELPKSVVGVAPSTSISVHDRLGAPPPSASDSTPSSTSPLASLPKRIINLREESSFPPKGLSTLQGTSEGMGRVISSAIASAVKSVAVPMPKGVEGRTGKKLEARVRPLFSSRRIEIKPEEPPEEVAPAAPVRVVSTVGAVLKRSHSSDEEERDEPLSKRVAGLASKVEVTPRPRRSKAMQANTALILRAVADAHKSVSKPNKKQQMDEKEEEKGKRQELFTRSYQERQSQRLSSSSEGKTVKKFAITVPNALLKDSVAMQIGEQQSAGEAYLEEIEMEEEYGPAEPETKIRQERVLPQTKPTTEGKLVPMQVDDSAGSTRFIVTLDGMAAEEANSGPDLRSRLSGRPVSTPSVEEEEFIEEVEEWEEVEEMEGVPAEGVLGQERGPTSAAVSFAPKWKAKIDASELVSKKEERCKFWPACKEGLSCPFIHPSKVCNTFPNCRFGDKCLYIHPNCKFDGACTRPNCPFTHAAARAYSSTFVAPVKPKIVNSKMKVRCRYYPKCVDMNCPFMHPKQICRYGKACQTPSCLYVHPDVTTGALLKWTAPKQTTAPASSSALSTAPVSQGAVPTVSTTTPRLTTSLQLTSSS